MPRRYKPRVITRCVANTYVGRSERIIEFTFSDGSGGLIQFADGGESGKHIVHVYRQDANVRVSFADPKEG